MDLRAGCKQPSPSVSEWWQQGSEPLVIPFPASNPACSLAFGQRPGMGIPT